MQVFISLMGVSNDDCAPARFWDLGCLASLALTIDSLVGAVDKSQFVSESGVYLKTPVMIYKYRMS